MDDAVTILKQILHWHEQGGQVALASVIKTWGSAPRRTGSMMCINSQLQFSGSVSGGCVETAVIEHAQAVIKTNQSQLLEFGVSDNQAFEVGLACGGNIEIFLQLISSKHIEAIKQLLYSQAHHQTCLLVMDVGEHNEFLVMPVQSVESFYLWDKDNTGFAQQSLRQDRPLILEKSNRRFFIQPFNPQLKVYIVGAVHIAQQLVAIVELLGFDTCVIDPRTAFANETRFANVEIINQWPEKAFNDLPINHRSAVIALTHDPKFDDPALKAAINSNAFYIGALGSRKTHASRMTRLIEQGVDLEQLDRIHGPIGLDISASNPSEIAVSIAAELIQQLRKDV